MIKTAPSALKKHFDNDIKNVKHSVMQKLVDEKKISQSVYNTLKKQKMKYNKGKKVTPKPSVKKSVPFGAPGGSSIREKANKIRAKNMIDKYYKEASTKSIEDMKKVVDTTKDPLVKEGYKQRIKYESGSSYTQRVKKTNDTKPKEKPKAKAPKMGKSITIKFDRDGGKWNTFPLEGVGHFKGKDIVYDHKGDEVKFRKYTYKMLHTITHSPTKWIVRDPDEPNQYYMTDGFGYKNSRSFIIVGDILREQDIDAPLSSMKVGYIL